MSPPIVLHHHGGQTQEGLVDHQQAGPGHEPARDGDHLLLAARQRVRELSPPLADDGKQALDQSQCLVAMGAGGGVVGAQHHVVEHGEKGKQATALQHVRQALARGAMGGQAVDAGAAEGDATSAWRDQPGDGVHQRGLARAVRPEHGHDLAVAHVHGRLPQHLEVAVGDVEVFHRQQWRRR